jgi:hypothetical protein
MSLKVVRCLSPHSRPEAATPDYSQNGEEEAKLMKPIGSSSGQGATDRRWQFAYFHQARIVPERRADRHNGTTPTRAMDVWERGKKGSEYMVIRNRAREKSKGCQVEMAVRAVETNYSSSDIAVDGIDPSPTSLDIGDFDEAEECSDGRCAPEVEACILCGSRLCDCA